MCCLLCADSCMLLVVCLSLFVASCFCHWFVLLVFASGSVEMLFAVCCCNLAVVCCLLFVVCCLLLIDI